MADEWSIRPGEDLEAQGPPFLPITCILPILADRVLSQPLLAAVAEERAEALGHSHQLSLGRDWEGAGAVGGAEQAFPRECATLSHNRPSLALGVVTIARWESVVGTTAPPPGLRPPHSVLSKPLSQFPLAPGDTQS